MTGRGIRPNGLELSKLKPLDCLAEAFDLWRMSASLTKGRVVE